MKKTKTKDLNYYKNNCEEDYIKTPISVLRYISELEQAINYTHCCKSDSELLPKRLSASAYTQAMSGNYEEFVKWWDSKSQVIVYNGQYMNSKNTDK